MMKLTAKKIVAPTDFSDQSEKAVAAALGMVERPQDVLVVHVAPPSESFGVGDPALVWQLVSEDARTEDLKGMLRNRFKDEKYRDVRFEVLFGSPAEEIAELASKEEADLIVLPSHGRSGLARLMIGSVAERVVRLAHCPVLVLRD